MTVKWIKAPGNLFAAVFCLFRWNAARLTEASMLMWLVNKHLRDWEDCPAPPFLHQLQTQLHERLIGTLLSLFRDQRLWFHRFLIHCYNRRAKTTTSPSVTSLPRHLTATRVTWQRFSFRHFYSVNHAKSYHIHNKWHVLVSHEMQPCSKSVLECCNVTSPPEDAFALQIQ